MTDNPHNAGMPPTGTGEVSQPNPVGGINVPRPDGSITDPNQGGINMPVGGGLSTAALEADVTDKLMELGPTFGEVLESIGLGVAVSQAELDAGMVETARQLSETEIEIVTDVIQKLNDDGLPDIDNTEIIKDRVSLINYVNPTVHEWKRVALSMDFSVGEIDNETGITFSRFQNQNSISGGSWGFISWFKMNSSLNYDRTNIETDYEANWAQGQVRVDATLTPRENENFPTPTQVVIGPQIFFSQGSIVETPNEGNTVVTRSVDVLVKVLRPDGAVNPNVNIQVEAPFLVSFSTDGSFNGSTTNADGEILVTFSRNFPAGSLARRARASVTAVLGQFRKSTTITL